MNIGYDILGNIAILKFDRKAPSSFKKKFALSYLKNNKNVKTVLEKNREIQLDFVKTAETVEEIIRALF